MNTKRKICWDDGPAEASQTVVTVDATVTRNVSTGPKRRIRAPAQPVRAGNGHVAAKTRELEDVEKTKIEVKLFIPNNGMIKSDLCVEFKNKYLPDEVTIFQVTGYVTACHGKVARGKIKLQNPGGYENFIRSHRTLWRTYDSPKYRAMRALPPANQHRRPRFAPVATVR